MSEKLTTPTPWHKYGPVKPPRGMIRIGDKDKRITVVRWGKHEDEADVCICVGPDQEANAEMIVNAAAELTRLRTELAASRAEVERLSKGLPKTADGVSVTPEDAVYDLLGNKRNVCHDRIGSVGRYWISVAGVDRRNFPEEDRWIVGVLRVDQCYSTREAALAARKEQQ